MAGSILRPSAADTAKQLNEPEKALGDERRSDELRQSLGDTGRILVELRDNLPERDV